MTDIKSKNIKFRQQAFVHIHILCNSNAHQVFVWILTQWILRLINCSRVITILTGLVSLPWAQSITQGAIIWSCIRMTITDIAVSPDMLHNLNWKLNSVVELVDSRCFMQWYITQQHCLSHNVSYQQVIQPETIINTTVLSPVHEPISIKPHLIFIQELLKFGTNCQLI